MPGTMSRADLAQDLKAILRDAAHQFTAADDADYARHLDIAARDLARVRPRTLTGTLALVADRHDYAAPVNLIQPKYLHWGLKERRASQPWQTDWPGRLPRLQLVEHDAVRSLWLDPAPTAAQIIAYGASATYFYFAAHTVDPVAANTTVVPSDRPLLLVRAASQALTELAHRNVTKPVQLGDGGVGSMPKNGTPAALAAALLKLFERMAC